MGCMMWTSVKRLLGRLESILKLKRFQAFLYHEIRHTVSIYRTLGNDPLHQWSLGVWGKLLAPLFFDEAFMTNLERELVDFR